MSGLETFSLSENQTIDHVFGLRRSGHHAVIEWLKGCYEVPGATVYHDNSVYNRHLSHAKKWPDPSPEVVWRRSEEHDALIVSYEDVDIDRRTASPVYRALRPPQYGRVSRDTIVVRDWFNMAASRLTYQANSLAIGKHDGLIFGLEWSDVEERWLKYAQKLRDDNDSSSLVCVNYNRWFSEREYRDELAQLYGLRNPDNCLDEVPDFGGGSSFDGRSMDGKGRSMNTLRRWENLAPDLLGRYKRLISNPILSSINAELFGIEQETVLSHVQSTRACG